MGLGEGRQSREATLWGPATQQQHEAQLLLGGLNFPGMSAEAGTLKTPPGAARSLGESLRLEVDQMTKIRLLPRGGRLVHPLVGRLPLSPSQLWV